MAPSTETLEAKFRSAIKETYAEDPSKLTVKYIRRKAENELGLDEGFFLTPTWKDKSKTFIKNYAVSNH
jgi:hypothetical protein